MSFCQKHFINLSYSDVFVVTLNFLQSNQVKRTPQDYINELIRTR